jgi:hypothetical protein
MLADLLPLMTETVRQIHSSRRDLFGRTAIAPPTEIWTGESVSYLPGSGTATDHRARVTYSPGKVMGLASREIMPDATATVWLIDHPHPIVIGDKFELPDSATLTVVHFERRKLPDGVLTKAYLT